MHIYRTHNCSELRLKDKNKTVRLSGWVHRKRDHGNLLFIDLRDHYGITQVVLDKKNKHFPTAEKTSSESVITVTGKVMPRSKETLNKKIPTGEIEISVDEYTSESDSKPLPLEVNSDKDYGEDTRLKYRYLDLRRFKMQKNILLRNKVISLIREGMIKQNFIEIQTPILTASSPEGARDYLVPSRIHPGKFYALPQAPQQFKQLLMIAGFDKYFQIAPCFRDEDSRADRSPGEFYQLDYEMSFATQEDIFNTLEPVLFDVFTKLSKNFHISKPPFKKIPFDECVAKYGNDKPDLRNPLILSNVTDIFKDSSFKLFAESINKGSIVIAIPAPDTKDQPRAFFDKLNSWAKSEDQGGMGYIQFINNEGKGPIANNLDKDRLKKFLEIDGMNGNSSIFFLCGKADEIMEFAAVARMKIANELKLIKENEFQFCWVVDYPMYQRNIETNKIEFSHNPFSMPQGGIDDLEKKDPLDIKAFQYDIVCNGVELSSGAIRNHKPEIMIKAFEIAGYSKKDLEKQFGGLLQAFNFGAPPHGGCAPGIDRIVMLIAGEPNIREIIPFPFNQKAEDLMMNAPAEVDDERLKELSLKILDLKKKE
ncbi:MAG: aspartate--tRNA ligase [Alphaproteobacteria bacterium]|nr:aspartate--tRNA ligase [Alphaproteobacteria bacterium]